MNVVEDPSADQPVQNGQVSAEDYKCMSNGSFMDAETVIPTMSAQSSSTTLYDSGDETCAQQQHLKQPQESQSRLAHLPTRQPQNEVHENVALHAGLYYPEPLIYHPSGLESNLNPLLEETIKKRENVISGVKFQPSDNRWIARWTTADGKRACKSYSVNIYGFEQARALAIEARHKGVSLSGRSFCNRERQHAMRSGVGIIGIRFDKTQARWVSSYYEGGKRKFRYFTVKDYGYEQAKQHAILWKTCNDERLIRNRHASGLLQQLQLQQQQQQQQQLVQDRDASAGGNVNANEAWMPVHYPTLDYSLYYQGLYQHHGMASLMQPGGDFHQEQLQQQQQQQSSDHSANCYRNQGHDFVGDFSGDFPASQMAQEQQHQKMEQMNQQMLPQAQGQLNGFQDVSQYYSWPSATTSATSSNANELAGFYYENDLVNELGPVQDEEACSVSGVTYDKKNRRWGARWTAPDGRRAGRYFPIRQYGFHEAKRLAIMCRMQAVEGEGSPE